VPIYRANPPLPSACHRRLVARIVPQQNAGADRASVLRAFRHPLSAINWVHQSSRRVLATLVDIASARKAVNPAAAVVGQPLRSPGAANLIDRKPYRWTSARRSGTSLRATPSSPRDDTAPGSWCRKCGDQIKRFGPLADRPVGLAPISSNLGGEAGDPAEVKARAQQARRTGVAAASSSRHRLVSYRVKAAACGQVSVALQSAGTSRPKTSVAPAGACNRGCVQRQPNMP